MTSTKHQKTKTPTDDDLRSNPGIGMSKGTIKEGDITEIEGDSTFEGDVENDTTIGGGVDANQKHRTNK